MSRRVWVIALAVVAVVLVLAVGGLVWWFQRGDAPAAVDLASVVAQVEAAGSADATSETPSITAASTAAPATVAAPSDTPDSSSGGGDGDSDAASDTGDTDSPTAISETPSITAASTAASTAAPATVAAPSDTPDSSGGGDGGSDAASDTGDTGSPAAAADDTVSTAANDLITEAAPADDAADALGHLSGVWTVQAADSDVDLLDNPAVSFAGYRVDEVLAGGLGENTAVGRTADVSGSIELSGGTLVASMVKVTMATLRTDDSHRDSHARKSLNTKEFPDARFTLVEPIELPAGMAEGQAVSGSAEGALTIKGVTKRATFELHAQLVGDAIVVVGSSAVVFSDYGVDTPSSISVISVEDHGIMEFQLIFTR